MSEYFFPKLEAVEALAPYRLRTTWSTGEVQEVDVEEVLRRFPVLSPIVNQRAKLTRQPGISALNFDHPG